MGVLLIENLRNTLVVVFGKSSVLHQLNCRFAGDSSRSALWPIVHDGHLQVLASLVPHCDCRVYWIVVSANVRNFVRDWANLLLWATSDIVITFNHLEGVTIGPELLLRVESIKHVPVDSEILASEVGRDGDLVEFYLKLDQLLEDSG
jgi:hypothetical protein